MEGDGLLAARTHSSFQFRNVGIENSENNAMERAESATETVDVNNNHPSEELLNEIIEVWTRGDMSYFENNAVFLVCVANFLVCFGFPFFLSTE